MVSAHSKHNTQPLYDIVILQDHKSEEWQFSFMSARTTHDDDGRKKNTTGAVNGP